MTPSAKPVGSRDSSDAGSEPSIPPAFEAYAEESLAQAPAGGPGKNGLLEAVLAREAGAESADGHAETRLVYDRTAVPYHLTGTLATDPAPGLATLLAQEPTGGVAQGDRHRIRIDAREGARAHVTTQGATKVHSMNANYAHLDARLRAGRDSHLEYLPGPTILNEDSRCLQTISVDLAPDAVAIVGDVLVPDGLSDHEAFGFDHYLATVEARSDGRLCCADRVDLRPAERDPRDPASVGDFDVVGTLYVFAPGDGSETPPADDLAVRLADRLAADAPDGVRAGATALADDAGAVVRALGTRETDVSAAIRAAWDETRRATLGVGAPADRRY